MNTVGIDLAQLSEDQVADYLGGRGISGVRSIETLTGGVSGVVIKVQTDGGSLIMKQALGRLATPGEWFADQQRTITEGRAIEALHAITPDHTAALVDVDPAALIVIMSCAPDGWSPWKEQLLQSGELESPMAIRVATVLGELLGRWHQQIDPALLETFDDHATFRALRSDPFYRALGVIHPDLSGRLHDLADDLDAARGCLMHGDYSPKNVLVDPSSADRLWVVDHEVAVNGSPVFDVAFMLCHLSCKSVRPPRRHLLRAAEAFRSAYCSIGRPVDETELAAHTAALMLARVDGVSRVGYLDHDEQQQVRRAAVRTLSSGTADLDQLWHELTTGDAS